MKAFLQLIAIFFLFALSVTAQPISRKEADSLLKLLNGSIPDTTRMQAILKLASFNVHQRKITDTVLNDIDENIREAVQLNEKIHYPYFSEHISIIRALRYKAQGKTEEGKAVLNQVIAALKGAAAGDGASKDNKALLGKAYYELSDFYSGNFLQPTMEERVRLLKIAISAYEQSTQYVELARCYRFLADLHQMLSDDESAFSEAKTALKYYDLAGYREKQGAVALLGRLYYDHGDYKQALLYELEALKIATASTQDNVRLICQINNNIGFTYSKLNDHLKALEYFQQSLVIAESEKDNGTVYLLAANVVETYLHMNQPGSAYSFFQQIIRKYPLPPQAYEGGDYGFSQTQLRIYLALKDYDQAKVYCERLIRAAANPNINLYTQSGYYQIIAKYYIESRDYVKAESYLDKDGALMGPLKNFSALAQYYDLRFSLDTARGKYKEAITNLIRKSEVKDSFLNETKSKQIAELEVQFETAKKENQISFLNEKSMLETTKLKQADLVKNVTIGGILLMLVIVALLYKQSNIRKRNNIIVTQKNQLLQNLLQEKEWLLKEVHHRVKNNLHTVICLLESQAQYLEKDALRAIETSQHRIYAMSLIHQKLYQSDNIGNIEVSGYLRELTSYLSQSFGSPAHIRMELNVAEVKLNLSQAIPLGLIINEAITNAYKYAFPGKRPGRILLELGCEEGDIVVVVADNGIGMRFVDGHMPARSLGMDLMRGLTSDLDGDICIENNNGTTIRMRFGMENIEDAAKDAAPRLRKISA